jgi:hypothetical protein
MTATSAGGRMNNSIPEPRPTFSMNALPYSSRCTATVDQNRPAGVCELGFWFSSLHE